MLQKSLPVEELCRKLKPLFGNKIDQIYFKYSISNSIEERNEILQILSVLYQKNLNKLLDDSILLEPPEKESVQGEYPLAEVVYAKKKLYPFALNESDFSRHICVTGMSGSGKTNFAFNILENFIKKDKPFLVFDWKKSFRSLINLDNSIACFTIGDDSVSNFFKTNINIPPKGVSPKEWINVLCDLLTESFSASFGVHKILLETLDEIFEGWEIYKQPEEKRHYPNWMHVKKMLELKAKEARGREATWYESALRIASVLTFGSFGKVINYDGKKSLSIDDLFSRQVIFELNSLGNIEKKFFCEFVLTYIYKYKKATQNRINEKFNYAILVDEAHNIFLNDKTHFVSESVTDRVYREMREYGIGLICLDQHISKLSDTVKGNSACHIAFQQQLPQDIMDISGIMQLPDKRNLFSKLPVGSAIVKLSERFTSPFLVEVPFIELRQESIDDSKISQRMEFIRDTVDAQKDREFMDKITNGVEIPLKKDEINYEIPPKLIQKVSSENKHKKIIEMLSEFMITELNSGKTLKEAEKALEYGLSEGIYSQNDILVATNTALENIFQSEKTFMVNNISEEIPIYNEIISTAIIKNETSGEHELFISFLEKYPNHNYSTVELYKFMGFSPRKGNKIKNELLDSGFIKIEEQKNANGWKKFIRLSDSYSPNKSINIQQNFN